MAESKATILIVDDEEFIRKLLKRTLEETGYNVTTAATGQEAIDIVSSSNISLVLLDIKMPNMDGFQVLNIIREKSDIPVIMVTGMGKVTSLMTSFNLGADDYIKKPFRSGELLTRIEAKLRRAKT